jgi:hypothetical protein
MFFPNVQNKHQRLGTQFALECLPTMCKALGPQKQNKTKKLKKKKNNKIETSILLG